MSRSLLALIGLAAVLAAVFLLLPAPDAPAPLAGGGITATDEPAARAEAPDSAGLDAAADVSQAARTGRTQTAAGPSGPIASSVRADGGCAVRAVDAAGQAVAPARFLIAGSHGGLEWIDGPRGELRFESLTGIAAVAAHAGGRWSAPVALEHGTVRHSSVELTVDQPAAHFTLRLTQDGQPVGDDAVCLWGYRQFRPDGELATFFGGEDEPDVTFEAVSDGSGRGLDASLFGRAFQGGDEDDPRARPTAGTLRHEDLPPGHYHLTCRTTTGVEVERWITLAPGADETVAVDLVTGGWLTGRVVDESGSPIPDALVASGEKSAAFAEFVGSRQLEARIESGLDGFGDESAGLARTDADGRFRLGPLAPGGVLLAAGAAGKLTTRAGDVDVVGGREVAVDPITLSAGHTVAVLVRDRESGEVLTDAQVGWRPAGEDAFAVFAEWTGSEETDEAGRHLLRTLPFRTLQIRAAAEGRAHETQEYLMPRANWQPGGEAPELVLLLGPGRTLEGRVLGADGAAVAGAEVAALDADATQNPMSMMAGLSAGQAATTLTDEQGAFLFENLEPGTWRVGARAPGHAPALSEEVDLTDAVRGAVDVQLGVPGSLVVRYRPAADEGAEGKLVVVTHLGMTLPESAETDADGEARFELLPAGDYSAQVIQVGDGQDVDSGDFDVSFEFFTLAAGEDKIVEMGPGLADASLEGWLTQNGQPASGITFTLLAGGGVKSTRTDEQGHFQIANVRPQRCSWFAGPGQAATVGREIVLESGENRLEFDLPGGGLEVTVVAASDGSAAVGVPVTAERTGSTLGNPVMAMTDGDGIAALRFLDPGEYRISAGTAAMPLFGGNQELGAAQKTVRVGDGQQELRIELEEGATFRIRALDLDGNPLRGASMFYLDEDGRPLSSLAMKATNASGVAQLTGLPPGPGRILVKHSAGLQKEFAVDLTAGQLSKREVRMEQGVIVHLRVLDAGEQPARGVMAVLRNDRGARISMTFSMQDAQDFNQSFFAGGEQRLGPVAPGRYTVELFRLGGRMTTQELTIPAGTQEIRKTLVYRP